MGIEKLINCVNVGKQYNNKDIISNINLTLLNHKLYVLVGPNGSGKSTLMKIISGIIDPTIGNVTVTDSVTVSYVSDDITLYEYLTGQEHINFFEYMNGFKMNNKIKKLIIDLNFEPFLDVVTKNYSKGTLQKLRFILGLFTNPQLLLLDEPLDGLDPNSIKVVRDFIDYFVKKEGSVIYATHIMNNDLHYDELLTLNFYRENLDQLYKEEKKHV